MLANSNDIGEGYCGDKLLQVTPDYSVVAKSLEDPISRQPDRGMKWLSLKSLELQTGGERLQGRLQPLGLQKFKGWEGGWFKQWRLPW